MAIQQDILDVLLKKKKMSGIRLRICYWSECPDWFVQPEILSMEMKLNIFYRNHLSVIVPGMKTSGKYDWRNVVCAPRFQHLTQCLNFYMKSGSLICSHSVNFISGNMSFIYDMKMWILGVRHTCQSLALSSWWTAAAAQRGEDGRICSFGDNFPHWWMFVKIIFLWWHF